MYTITYVSVRCDGEDPVGRKFTSLSEAQKYVRESFIGLEVYWRVYIYEAGNKVMMGTRSGKNATGKRWIWQAL